MLPATTDFKTQEKLSPQNCRGITAALFFKMKKRWLEYKVAEWISIMLKNIILIFIITSGQKCRGHFFNGFGVPFLNSIAEFKILCVH